jgi:hypothetical protein
MRAKNRLLKISLITLLSLFISTFFSYFFKNQELQAASTSDQVVVNLSVSAEITISSPSDVTLTPNIPGMTGGVATGSAAWTVTTNNSSGYKLELAASTTPAMQSGADSFSDYTEATPGTPENWSVSAADSEFGFGISGTHAETKYSVCTNGAGQCFEGFTGTTKMQVSHSNAETSSSGTSTSVNFKAESGSAHSQPSGAYAGYITATATTL